MSNEMLEKVQKANSESMERGRLKGIIDPGDPIDNETNATLSEDGKMIILLEGHSLVCSK